MDKTSIFFANPDKPGHVVRSIVALGIVCMLLFAAVGCETTKEASEPDEIEDCEDKIEQCDKDNAEPLTELKGTKWRLVGIVETGVDTLEKLEPKNCEECFTLTFETNRIFTARGVRLTFRVDMDNIPDAFPAIPWCDYYNGRWTCDNDLFHNALRGVGSYSATPKELRLYTYQWGDPAEGVIWYAIFRRVDL